MEKICAGVFQNLCVGYFVLPLDAQNAPQTSQVEAVEFPLMGSIGGPCLAAVEECVEHTDLVYVQFGLLSEVFHTLWFSLAITAAVMATLLFSSSSTVSEMQTVDPRYVNFSTTSKLYLSMLMVGMVMVGSLSLVL